MEGSEALAHRIELLDLPSGWQVGTALPVESNKGPFTQFKTVSLETFADSPALCGIHFKEVPIGPKDGPSHFLTLACDSAAGLALSDELKGHYDRLVVEAGACCGNPLFYADGTG